NQVTLVDVVLALIQLLLRAASWPEQVANDSIGKLVAALTRLRRERRRAEVRRVWGIWCDHRRLRLTASLKSICRDRAFSCHRVWREPRTAVRPSQPLPPHGVDDSKPTGGRGRCGGRRHLWGRAPPALFSCKRRLSPQRFHP